MKKLLLFFALTIFLTAFNSIIAQEIVSTDPMPRNVILEEFTGIYCGWCPEGHIIANQLMADYPGRVFAINIHTGGYAKPQQGSGHPDFRTPWGPAIAAMSGLTGFPSGQVNRQYFNGSNALAMGRGSWANVVAQVFAETENSPVNIGAKTIWNEATRTLELTVELYYTADAGENNKLNIAFLENDFIGYQSGPKGGENYVHKHILRDLITGQWGEEISETTEGTLFTKTYSYVVGDEYPIDNCSLVFFVTQADNKYIYTGIEVPAITPNLKLETVGEVYSSVQTGNDLGKTVTVSNTTDVEFTFDASVSLSDRTPADWEVSVSGENGFTVDAGESVDVAFSITPGSTMGIGDAILLISETNVDNPLSYSAKVTAISNEIEYFEIIDKDETSHSIMEYVPEDNNYFQIPSTDFENIYQQMTNLKTFIWNTAYSGEHTAKSEAAISYAMKNNINVFLTGCQSLSSASEDFLLEFRLYYEGYSMEGYIQNTPSPWTANLAGIEGDPISGDYTEGFEAGWTYYPFYIYSSFNDTETIPFLAFRDQQAVYVGQNSKNVAGAETNYGFRIQKGDTKAVFFCMTPNFIKDATIREKLIENSFAWLEGTTDVEDDYVSNGNLSLSASPNPFENASQITYVLNGDMPRNIRLSLFNELGIEVALIEEGMRNAGTHTIDYEVSNLSAGAFYLVLRSGAELITMPVAHIK